MNNIKEKELNNLKRIAWVLSTYPELMLTTRQVSKLLPIITNGRYERTHSWVATAVKEVEDNIGLQSLDSSIDY